MERIKDMEGKEEKGKDSKGNNKDMEGIVDVIVMGKCNSNGIGVEWDGVEEEE